MKQKWVSTRDASNLFNIFTPRREQRRWVLKFDEYTEGVYFKSFHLIYFTTDLFCEKCRKKSIFFKEHKNVTFEV